MGGTRRGGADVNIKHSGREDNERERERFVLSLLPCHLITINWKQVPIGKRERRTWSDNQRP